MDKKILRLPEVIASTGCCRSKIYQDMKDGIFPQSVRLGARSVGWRSDEVDTWIVSRIRTNNEMEIR